MELIHARPTEYHSYLLRMWRNSPQQPWHASAQSTSTGEVHHFATVVQLLDFLNTHSIEEKAPATQTPSAGDNVA